MAVGRNGGRAVGGLAVIIGLLVAISVSAQEQMGIAYGAVPDSVRIEDLDGVPVDLHRWIGQGPVLFEFWATWCPNCAALEPRMIEWHRQFGDQVAFVAIAVGVNQNPRSIKRHLERHEIPWPTLWDTRGRAVRAFTAFTTSYVVILDAEGKVVYTGSGAGQDLGPALERVASAPR